MFRPLSACRALFLYLCGLSARAPCSSLPSLTPWGLALRLTRLPLGACAPVACPARTYRNELVQYCWRLCPQECELFAGGRPLGAPRGTSTRSLSRGRWVQLVMLPLAAPWMGRPARPRRQLTGPAEGRRRASLPSPSLPGVSSPLPGPACCPFRPPCVVSCPGWLRGSQPPFPLFVCEGGGALQGSTPIRGLSLPYRRAAPGRPVFISVLAAE